MSSPFFFSNPFLHNFIQILPSRTPLHPTIRPKSFLFNVSSPISTSKPHEAKLFDEIPQRDFYEKNTFTRFSSSRQGKGGENGNLMKYVDSSKEMKEGKMGLKGKLDADEVEVGVRLDMCLKTGDVLGALFLYEEAAEKGLRLHLCSTAEMSGSNGGDCGLKGIEGHASLARKEWMSRTNGMEKSSGGVFVGLSDDARDNAGRRGVEKNEKMCAEKFPMSEEAKTFSSCGSVETVFEVEKDMMELGITSEEYELEELLRDSVEAGRGEKVYDLLHKLRVIVRKVSLSTADAIDAWFRSSAAVRVGKRKWDIQAVKQAMENCGGGWHGLGWLGKGKWNVVRTRVDGEGVCLCCGEKLVSVDLDPFETERFAECVESIVIKKERNSNFEKFQKWLEYYGPFEAVIDAANVGLFNQRRFSLNKVNAVANGIRQKLPSKKWPLIIIHNKRLSGGKMNEPCNRKLVEKWKNADAIYETPTGSNDDWYWLYAAIKCKCLVVTNDEMRDHVFQALGNDSFVKWKERHQVHFNHIDGSFQFIMPHPFSVVIQESERGHWHIPIAESEQGLNRSWMCVTRASSPLISVSPSNPFTDIPVDSATEITDLDAEASEQLNSSSSSKDPQKRTKSSSQMPMDAIKPLKSQIVSAIEDAEKIGGCIIDFEI